MLRRIVLTLISAVVVTVGFLPTAAAQEGSGLPPPTGPYPVGATFRQWIDDSREEAFTEDSEDKRILSAWVFYPADVDESAERMPYVMDETIIPPIRFFVVDVYEQDFETTFAVLSQWESYAYRDAPLSGTEPAYPVILITVNSGLPVASSLQAVELASHGYIVVEVLHTYGYPTEFTNSGLIIGHSEEVSFDWLMELCVTDNMAILNQLAVTNAADSHDSLAGRLDLTRIGITGGSIAGGIARETALRDTRITAGISQDGAFEPFAPTPLEQPFMYVYEVFDPGPYYQQSEVPAYRIRFRGFRHGTFSDLIFWPGLQDHPAVLSHSVTSERAHEIYTTYFVAFFDEYLKGEEQPLLDGESEDFPEVLTFESMNTD